MAINFKIKKFQELNPEELYEILRLRSEVFVVEQNCVYQDIDNKDQIALHIMGQSNHQLVAYCRIFNAKDYFENASIGRVIVKINFRDQKLGVILMNEAIAAIKKYFNQTKITIAAQYYLLQFYESFGFVKTSEVYLEDDIEHIQMNYDYTS